MVRNIFDTNNIHTMKCSKNYIKNTLKKSTSTLGDRNDKNFWNWHLHAIFRVKKCSTMRWVRKNRWWQRCQKFGGFIKCFRIGRSYRKSTDFRNFFMYTYWSKFLSFWHPYFFLFFFFWIYGEKNIKKDKRKKRSADDKNFRFLTPVLTPIDFVSIKSGFFRIFLSPA